MLYQENAFRILGVPANATHAMIQETYHTLHIRARAGRLVCDNDYLSSICRIEQSESKIRDAFNKLLNPKTRLHERLFWFSNSTQVDKNALARLLSNDLSGAIQIWETNQNYTSIANLARLYHAHCISRDPDVLDLCLWQKAMEKWCAAIKDGEFWEFFIDIEINSGFEPFASNDEIDELLQNSWELVLKPSINHIQDAIDKERDDIAQRHLDLIRNSGLSLALVNQIEGDLTEILENKINEFSNTLIEKLSDLLLNTENSLEIKKRGCDRAYQYYKNDLLKQVQRLELLAGKESDAYKRAREITASCLRNISIYYHNHLDSYELSEKLLKEAEALTQDTIISEKIKEDLLTVEKHAQHEKIWKDIKPINEAPSLHTINGFGKTLYGRKDYDPVSETYISTLYFVVFFIPLFPIARYRVKKIGDGKFSYYGKAPLRTFDKWHIAIALFLLILCIIMILQNNHSNYSVKRPVSYNYSQPQKTTSTKTEMLKKQIESAKYEIDNRESELKELDNTINSYENKINFYAAKIQKIERDNSNGNFVDQNEYEKLLGRHNYYVDLYNTELNLRKLKYSEYEQLLEEINNKVGEFNKMIGRQ